MIYRSNDLQNVLGRLLPCATYPPEKIATTQHTLFIYIKHSIESNSFKFCRPYLNFTETDYSWWLYAVSNDRVLQRATSDILQRTYFAMSNERILQGVTSEFLQWTTSATSNELSWNEQQLKSYAKTLLEQQTP